MVKYDRVVYSLDKCIISWNFIRPKIQIRFRRVKMLNACIYKTLQHLVIGLLLIGFTHYQKRTEVSLLTLNNLTTLYRRLCFFVWKIKINIYLKNLNCENIFKAHLSLFFAIYSFGCLYTISLTCCSCSSATFCCSMCFRFWLFIHTSYFIVVCGTANNNLGVAKYDLSQCASRNYVIYVCFNSNC